MGVTARRSASAQASCWHNILILAILVSQPALRYQAAINFAPKLSASSQSALRHNIHDVTIMFASSR